MVREGERKDSEGTRKQGGWSSQQFPSEISFSLNSFLQVLVVDPRALYVLVRLVRVSGSCQIGLELVLFLPQPHRQLGLQECCTAPSWELSFVTLGGSQGPCFHTSAAVILRGQAHAFLISDRDS